MQVFVTPLDWSVIIVYFAMIVAIGMWFGKFTRTTKEFFLGGQRFSWWLVSFSCVATLVGSYSFVQYSQMGFNFGFCSMTPYTNEWFVLPLFLVVWLPVIYYGGMASIPEYFERRFNRRTRMLVLLILLLYLQGFVGINLYTIGLVMNALFDWNAVLHELLGMELSENWSLITAATVIAILAGLYLHVGGQTSVLMTDLLQGLLLLITGFGVILLGIHELGGFTSFWDGLPAKNRLPFPQFNHPPQLHSVGDFWADAITGSFAYYFINQGMMMRFLSAKSVHDSRRAMLCFVMVLMPIAAIAVGGAGWVGRSMVSNGIIASTPTGEEGAEPGSNQDKTEADLGKNIFVLVARKVCQPGVFGLVIAAVVAALMSTLDTFVTAVSALAVNDVWRTFRPDRADAYYLRVARRAAIVSTLIGIVLIPVFAEFKTVYQALYALIAVTTPPLMMVILMGVLWPRFTSRAAFWTLLLGSGAVLASLFFPEIITPFAHGVEMDPERPYGYMRSLFGLVTSGLLAISITIVDHVFFGASQWKETRPGMVVTTLHQGIAAFKGGPPNYRAPGRSAVLSLSVTDCESTEIRLPGWVLHELQAEPGDLLYISDARRWLGGFRSVHGPAGPATETEDAISVSRPLLEKGNLLADRPTRVEKII